MHWLGMCALGAFVGYVVTFGLVRITDWTKPANALAAVLSAAVGGIMFVFLQRIGSDAGSLALYSLGLGYGALCTNLRWVTEQHASKTQIVFATLHVAAFAGATILLLLLFLSPTFRALLPA